MRKRNDEGWLNEEGSARKQHAEGCDVRHTHVTSVTSSKKGGDGRGKGRHARHRPKSHVTPGVWALRPSHSHFSLLFLFFLFFFLFFSSFFFPSFFFFSFNPFILFSSSFLPLSPYFSSCYLFFFVLSINRPTFSCKIQRTQTFSSRGG